MHPTDDLTAFVDGALGERRRAAVSLHLEGCAECREARDRIGAALAVLALLPPPPEPSPGFAARLEARLAGVRRPSLAERLAGWRWRIAAPVAAAAAAVVVAGVAVERERAAREADVAAHLDLLEDYVTVASLGDVSTREDAAVVEHLDELVPEGKP